MRRWPIGLGLWLLVLAAIEVVCLAAVCRFFVQSEHGQLLDTLALAGNWIGRTRIETLVDRVLNTVSVVSLVAATAVIGFIALIRRRVAVAFGAILLIVGANVTTQVLKLLLDRPELGVDVERAAAGNSLPSGHTTVAAAVVVALLLVLPARAGSPRSGGGGGGGGDVLLRHRAHYGAGPRSRAGSTNRSATTTAAAIVVCPLGRLLPAAARSMSTPNSGRTRSSLSTCVVTFAPTISRIAPNATATRRRIRAMKPMTAVAATSDTTDTVFRTLSTGLRPGLPDPVAGSTPRCPAAARARTARRTGDGRQAGDLEAASTRARGRARSATYAWAAT